MSPVGGIFDEKSEVIEHIETCDGNEAEILYESLVCPSCQDNFISNKEVEDFIDNHQ